MATLAEKIRAEHRVRTICDQSGLQAPDEVEYGHACIRLLWHDAKVCLVVDIDEAAEESPGADDPHPATNPPQT